MGMVSIFYCGTYLRFGDNLFSHCPVVSTLRAFYKRRGTFRAFVVENHHITFHQYCRLVLMAIVEVAFTVPLSTFLLIKTVTSKSNIYPYKGLADLHYDFGRVRQLPAAIWISIPVARDSIEQNEITPIGCAIFYFLLFGLTQEARSRYVFGYNAVAGRLRLPMIDTSKKSTTCVRPVLLGLTVSTYAR